MIRSALLVVFIVLMGVFSQLQAQVASDSLQTDSLSVDTSAVDTLTTVQTVKPEDEKPKGPENIVPWKQFKPSGQSFVADDSLLRWQIWPNWGDYYAYRKDVISFRQGTIGRLDAFQISGFSQDEQTLSLEGINLSNPITGLVNYNYVPHHKIGSFHEKLSAGYHSDIELKKYYILEPISYLNYDEAKFNYRNLEFMVTQNFSERTNIELSFWDRRDGDNYPRNEVIGNQIVARGYHYLNQNIQLRTLYLRNQFDLQEPFGYVVDDPLTFSFDQFISTPKVSNASSKTSRRDWLTGIYSRPDSNSVENMGLEFTLTKNEFELPSSATDTLNWDLRSYSARTFKVFGNQRFSLKLEGEGGFHSFNETRNITRVNWSDFRLSAEAQTNLDENLQVFGLGTLLQRGDGFNGTEIGGGAKLTVNKLEIVVSGALFSRMPTIQELYWTGVNFSGNEALKNENGISVYGQSSIQLTEQIRLGASGRIKQSNNDVFLGNDSTLVNSGDISSISGTVFGSFENHRFEIESSATFDALNNISPEASSTPLGYNEQKVWIRNNAFIKGYAFDRATYVKLGVRTTLSPLPYGSKFFNTELQYWQANSTEVDIPAFFRLDAELSARVRAMMIVMRWENALDGIGQLGYFEAATFPMNSRRLIVGIRAQFRN
ncbi:MAG: putative porin [Balneola sp.]